MVAPVRGDTCDRIGVVAVPMLPCCELSIIVPATIVASIVFNGSGDAARMSPPVVIDTAPPEEVSIVPMVMA